MIEKMNQHYAFENLPSVYDEEALTALELAGRQGAKINEIIDAQNNLEKNTDERLDRQDDHINYIQNVTVPEEVTKEVQRQIDNGTFDEQIHNELNGLNERVDNLLSSTPEGGTTMDAEIIDARMLASSLKYSNLGSTVRAVHNRVKELKADSTGNTILHEYTGDCKIWMSGEPITSNSRYYLYDTTNALAMTVQPTEASANIGFTTKIFTPKQSKIRVKINLGCNRESCLELYAGSGYSTENGNYARIGAIPTGISEFVIDSAVIGFTPKCVWFVTNGNAAESTYTYTFYSLTVSENWLTDNGFEGDTVSKLIFNERARTDALRTKLHYRLNRNGIEHTNYDVSRMHDISTWGLPKSALSRDIYHDTLSWNKPGNNGIIVPLVDVDTSRLVRVDFDYELTTSDEYYNVSVYVANGAAFESGYVQLKSFTDGGSNKASVYFDAAHLSVYNNIKTPHLWILTHNNSTTQTMSMTVKNLRVTQNALLDSGYPGEIDKAIVQAANREITAPVSPVTKVVDPNGVPYILQVNSNGSLNPVHLYPSKVAYLGNSLLLGFESFGMAASDNQHDYYALINAALRAKNPSLVATKYQSAEWEVRTSTEAQNEWLTNTLNNQLAGDEELVLIQLGDNVNTPERKAVFYTGVKNLLSFIRKKCPNARVAWVGQWYADYNMVAEFTQACAETGCTAINICACHGTDAEASIGDTYTMPNGEIRTITDAGVASHPSDVGFRRIANKVLYVLGITDDEEYYKED